MQHDRLDAHTRDLLHDLVDVGEGAAVEASVFIHAEQIFKATPSHFEYSIFDGGELIADVLVIAKALRTCTASSSLAFNISHRGDSGSSRMKVNMTTANIIWKAMGNLQEIELGSKKEKPKSSQ